MCGVWISYASLTRHDVDFFMLQIAPICKDDLVCLPKRLLRKAGGGSPLMLCLRVTTNLTLMDPITLRRADVRSGDYFANRFRAICNTKQLVEFTILDIELIVRSSLCILRCSSYLNVCVCRLYVRGCTLTFLLFEP